MKLLLSLLLCILLCGCGREPEDRAFVCAVWIDESEGAFEIALLTARGEDGGEDSEEAEAVITGRGKSLYSAIEDCSKKSSGELFFSHASLCILSPEVIGERETLRSVSQFIEDDAQLGRRIMLAVSEDGERALKSTREGMNIAEWLNGYYQTHKEKSPVEGDRLCRAMAERGNLMLPAVEVREKEFEMSGGALIAEGAAACELRQREYEQISLLIDDGSKPVAALDGGKTAIRRRGVKIQPYRVIIEVEETAENGEFIGKPTRACREEIKRSAVKAIEILQRENCDLIDMYRAFEIKRLPEEDFKNMSVEVEIR